ARRGLQRADRNGIGIGSAVFSLGHHSMIEVRVPDEQEGTKAVVRAWLRRVGDLVFENEPLVELETDKVTQEVPSPAAGVLTEILLDTDDEAEPGALLAKIDPAAEATSSPAEIGIQGGAAAAPIGAPEP